jgi:hypothetical protein
VSSAVRQIGEVYSRLARGAVALADTRRGLGIVFVAALAVWWLQALVIPLGPGRDFGTYLGGYLQLFHGDPIDLGYLLGRTPIATVLVGGLLDFAGGALAEPVMSLLYAASIVAWFLAARTFGARAALLTTVVLLAYPGYGILFHELSSDSIVAAAFAGWSLLAVRALRAPSLVQFAVLGAGVGGLALIRPANQALIVLAAVPLLILRWSWRTRFMSVVAFLVPAIALLAGWTVHNGIRYDNFTLARGGNATVPFFRAFVADKIVRPDNGPESRELARTVQRELLPEEPYRSYGIDLDEFFSSGSARMHEDLVALADRKKGWKTNHRWLRDVGGEAVRAHPLDYAQGVGGTIWGMLTQGLYRSLRSAGGGGGSAGSQSSDADTILVDGRRLPKPTEDEPIPAAHEGGVATPDGSIYTVWTSPSEHHLVFVHPGDEQRYDSLHESMNRLAANLPARKGDATLARRLNQASRWFPPPLLWLALAVVALAVRRRFGSLALWVPAAAALIVVVLTALGVPTEPHYSVPVAPAFVLLAAGALFAPKAQLAPAVKPIRLRARSVASWQQRLPRTGSAMRLWAGTAVGVAAALLAVTVYFDDIDASFEADEAPHDLAVFLRAAVKVLDGVSPYAFQGDQTYAYPPFLAFLAAPFAQLAAAVAMLTWTIMSLAAIGVALWLLGVRDWRCYALTAVYPLTRSAVGLGTVEPLLLLAVAVTWRWRDHIIPPALALGAAVALKLFLWPLAVWLALTGRIRSALAGLAAAFLLVLVPWAVIGFDGFRGYPDLLQRLSDQEATSSYSVVALVVRAHLPEAVGFVISALLALALLGVAARIARDPRWQQRDRDVATLTLALAAGLAASPIVWIHYFLLLVVPLALTRPRLSALWFLPLAYYPLGETAWPAGDARKLALALVTTVLIFVATLFRRSSGPTPIAAPAASASAPVSRPVRLTRTR